MRFSQTIHKVIALSEAAHAYWNAELPKRHPNYPFIREGDEDGPPPPEEKKLRKLLARLPEDLLYKLALIRSIGRLEYGTDHLAEHYQELKERLEKPEWLVTQLVDYPALSEDLADGIAALQKAGIDVEKLRFAPVHFAD